MKKILVLFLFILGWVSLSSCGQEATPTVKDYTVRFDSSGGTVIALQKIPYGKKAEEPEEPIRDGYEFIGWFYKDEKFDFSQEITENILLTAKWEVIKIELMEYYKSMEKHLSSDFKENLHSLLKTTHKKQLAYSEVWDALKKVDQDPQNKDNILCIYTGRSIPIANQDKGSAGENLWNREHAWPNSHGFSSRDYKAYTDLHHLFASEKNINATRGDKDFNIVTGGNTDSYGNRWAGHFFEPRDEVKGDLARAMFYLVVRYDDSNELDLELVNTETSSSSNKKGQLGFLSVLLKWHLMDPVSDKERKRNEQVFEIQGNRNPFVDYPDWVNLLYPSAS